MRGRLSKYGFFGVIKLFYYVIRTKLLFKRARIIRFPFEIRGRRHITLKKGFTSGVGCRIEAFPACGGISLSFGENFQMNDYVHITAMRSVVIGDNVLIASKVYISDCSHGSYFGDDNDSHPESIPKDRPLFAKSVHIEDNVWLGEFVSVLPGVTIGKGTIVGANSVVSRSLPPNVIAVGTPAIPIKRFNFHTNKWTKI
ncbi:DapH/DapD/GlmU-related protein [Sphingobacterium multivorum]|uniref:DapH/DapD/GlmU-related protein n=1 Tax=Sphingobacterium multivorum TaxID=28454 RepID=UPI0028A2126A|nr:DapH/DapD/GlmU-related protein [Sphingobacterium multivorum]